MSEPRAASAMSSPPDLAVNDREELIYLLTEAAEFEHTVMCGYLYAQWSLRREESEGVSADELAAIDRWRRRQKDGQLRRTA